MGQSYLSRREFLAAGGAAFVAATGLTVEQAMAQKGFRLRGAAPGVGSMQTLAPSDLAKQGYIKYATGNDSFGNAGNDLTFSQGATTIRVMPNGDRHVLIVGKWGQAPNEQLLEFDITGITPSATLAGASRAPLIRNWGSFAESNYEIAGGATGSNKKLIGGLVIDPSDYTKLWWSYGDSYFSSGYGYYCTLGSTLLNDAAGTLSSYGPWNFYNHGGQRMRGHMFTVPAAWASANGLGSKTIGISAGNSSGLAGAPYGCNAHVFESFDPTAKAPDSYFDSNGSISVKTLILHTAATPQTRNTDYKECGMSKDPGHGNAYSCAYGSSLVAGSPNWGTSNQAASNDTITGVQFVQNASREALLFFGRLTMAPPWTPELSDHVDSDGLPHNGYFGFDTSGVVANHHCCHDMIDNYNSGPGEWSSYRNGVMWSYPLTQIAEVIAGSRAVDGCVPDTDAYSIGSLSGASDLRVMNPPKSSQMYYDSAANLMYYFLHGYFNFDNPVGIYNWPVISVWSVAS